MTERMDDWNPPESWKRITRIMMIRAGHQNKDIMTAVQCSLNTVKTIRHELETCNGDYEDVPRRKIPSRRSDCVHTAEFLANLQEQVLKNPGIGSGGYVELLNTVVKPWITRVAKGRPYVWEQNSAPCHTSGKSQKWLSENFYDFTSPNVWPPNSPDLNPMDYFV
ncbi:Transposable element Tcb2 transposase, partial [Stegodyphus mimosarum]